MSCPFCSVRRAGYSPSSYFARSSFAKRKFSSASSTSDAAWFFWISSSSRATSSALCAFCSVISWLSRSSIFDETSSCTSTSPSWTIVPSGTSEMMLTRPCTSFLSTICWLGAISPNSSTLMTSGPSATVAYKVAGASSSFPPRKARNAASARTRTAGTAIFFFTAQFLSGFGGVMTPSATRSASVQVPLTDTSRRPRSRWSASSWFL